MRKVTQRHRRAFRRRTHVQAEFPSSYPNLSAFRPLRSTVITRFPATMSRSDSRPEPTLRLFIPPRRWSRRARPPRRVSQVPRLIYLRALSPTTPRSPAAAVAPCFTTSVRFHPHPKTDHFPFAPTRPKRVHLRYGSRIRRSRLRRWNYSHPRSIGYLLNGQLQDKLLSACKISQAFPGTRMSARQKRLMEVGQSRDNRTACPSTTYHQHADLPFEQLRVDAVCLHDQLLNARFRARRTLVASRRHRSGSERETSSCQQDFSTTH